MTLPIFMLLLSVPAPSSQGDFRFGQWSGTCFRDGFLGGMKDELCRARLEGSLAVELHRDADKVRVTVIAGTCARSKLLPRSHLKARDRVRRVLSAMQGQVRQAQVECRIPDDPPTFSYAQLEATLRETDGLIHIARAN